VAEYECATSEEFVWIQVCDDLYHILDAYLAKFPNFETEVKKTFERLAGEMCGEAVGPDTYGRIMGIRETVYSRMFSSVSRRKGAATPPGRP
jgi:hypothetical protein